MNEKEKNDWDRKADEIDEVIHQLIQNTYYIDDEQHITVQIHSVVLGKLLRRLEGIKRHCQGLAESHRA